MNKKSEYELFYDELKQDMDSGKPISREDMQLLGRMIVHNKWENFKSKLRFWRRDKHKP